ncbi:hypothetical protein Hanom_Chr17g01570831 [Helianthus anomalus]
MHMWRTIPFEKMGWRNVRQSHRDAIINHLEENFNFDEAERDYEAQYLKDGIEHVLMKRYSGRKNLAKREFLKSGGYNDVERARAPPPPPP